MAFVLFDLLTWPLIVLGLIRGSFSTYKCLKQDVSNEQKEEQLQYWVVFASIVFFFPWFDKILGWFLFAGLIGILKLMLLIMVVVTRSKYGFLYKLIEEQFSSWVEPSVKKALKFSEGFRTQACDLFLIFLTSINQELIHLLITDVSNENLKSVRKNLNNMMEIVTKEETQRNKKQDRKNDDDKYVNETNNVNDSTRIKQNNEKLKS